MHSRVQLANDFRALGVQPGDVIMLHASVRAVGEIAGGPDEIHLALGDALTPEGTLMMYASCPQYVDEIGRGNLTAEQEAELLEKLPAFDARTARAARDNGTLVEFFRTYPGSRVNDHVVRFVARGKHTEHLFREQPWDFAFGKGSALDRLVELDGKILHLGSDYDTTTFLHYAEHVADFPGKRIARYKVPVAEKGRRAWRDMSEVDTSSAGAHPNWPTNFFAILVRGYLEQSRNPGGKVGDAPSVVFSAPGLLDYAIPVMQRVANGERP